MRRAGVERIAMASRSVTVSAPAREESPTTTVAMSADGPLTSNTGPSRVSQVVTAGAPVDPMFAGRNGTDESIAGVLRRFSHALRATKAAHKPIVQGRPNGARILRRETVLDACGMMVRQK
jgi:hypothetical protein